MLYGVRMRYGGVHQGVNDHDDKKECVYRVSSELSTPKSSTRGSGLKQLMLSLYSNRRGQVRRTLVLV